MNTDLKNVIALTAGGSFTAITFQSQNKTTYINQEYYIYVPYRSSTPCVFDTQHEMLSSTKRASLW